MPPKATLHFVCGKLASGKTTLAQQLAKEMKAVFVSEDEWLAVLYPDQIKDFEDYLDRSSRFRAAIAPLVQVLLGMGVPIVGGNVPKERAWVKSLCQYAKIPLVLHYIRASDELCKKQLRKRNDERVFPSRYTTEDEFDQITKYFCAPRPDEGYTVKEYDADFLSKTS